MVGCLVLGDEMAHVLENDPAVQNILIVDTDEGRVFRKKLDSEDSRRHIMMVRDDELERLDLSGPSIVVWVNDANLHDDPRGMLEKLASNVHSLEGHCGSVLVFYGLCRNTRYEMKRFSEAFEIPVTLLTDEDGEVVDDCFAAVLGGRDRYASMLRARDKAILLTPGYAEHWAMKLECHGLEAMIQHYESYQLLFETLGYNKVMVLDNGLGDREALRERARLFAAVFDMTIDTARCDINVFERSYQMAWSKMLVPTPVRESEREAVLSKMLP
jgi:hypothetical protein